MTRSLRRESDIAGVRQLKALLDEIVERPERADDTGIRDFLSSQGALAKFSSEHGFRPCSLNKLKRLCADAFEGGFVELDRSRNQAFAAINMKAAASSKASAAGSKVQDVQARLDVALEDLFQMTGLLRRALALSKQIADAANSSSLQALCARERRDLLLAASFLKSGKPNG